MMTDPIADMLTPLRHAPLAPLDRAHIPLSKLKPAIAKLPQQEGYAAHHEVGDRTLTLLPT